MVEELQSLLTQTLMLTHLQVFYNLLKALDNHGQDLKLQYQLHSIFLEELQLPQKYGRQELD